MAGMSFWQFGAAVAGWNRAQGGEAELPPPTKEQHEYLIAKYG